MTDRKPLDQMTNDDIRREIAERLGYHVEFAYMMTVYSCKDEKWSEYESPHFVLWDKDSHRVSHLYFGGPMPEDEAWKRVPNWPDDLNAAAELLADGWGLLKQGDDWRVLDIVNDDYGAIPILAYADHPARAICLAFVARKKEKKHE